MLVSQLGGCKYASVMILYNYVTMYDHSHKNRPISELNKIITQNSQFFHVFSKKYGHESPEFFFPKLRHQISFCGRTPTGSGSEPLMEGAWEWRAGCERSVFWNPFRLEHVEA